MRPTRLLTALLLCAATTIGLLTPAAPAHALDPPLDFWDESTAGLAVNGTYIPVVGNFGSPLTPADDIFWYAPGAATDYLWLSNNDTTFSKQASPKQISGTYTPVVGDFSGNGLEDIVWYAPGAAQDYLWTANGLGFDSAPVTISGTYTPSVLDDQAGKDDIVWARNGGGAGYVWSFEGMGNYLSTPMTSPAGSRALVGHFGAGICADIFWYAPGVAADSLWMMNCAGTAGSSFAQTVNGHYKPVVGDFVNEFNGHDDIVWYRTGAQSTLWTTNGDDCGRRQAAVLDPGSLFAAAPLVVLAPEVRSTIADGLRAAGVPLDTTMPDSKPAATEAGPPSRRRTAALLVSAAIIVAVAVAGVALVDGDEADRAAPPATTVGTSSTTEAGPRSTATSSSTTTTTTTSVAGAAAPTTQPPNADQGDPPGGSVVPNPATTTARPATTTTTQPAAPRIDSFGARPAAAPGGACGAGQWATTVRWTTTNATSARLGATTVTPITGLAPDGSRVVCRPTPGKPRGGWTLTATGPGGEASRVA